MRLLWTLLVGLVATPAFAQDAGDTATARSLGTEGLRLAEAGDCAAAVDKLARAENLYHAPTTLERLGECQVTLGHYVEGTENLRRVARERLGDRPPSVFVNAQTRAREVLEQALPHLAKLRIDVGGNAAAGDVILKIDGATVSSATIGVERAIDPGAHTIEASAVGYKKASNRIQIGEGGAQAVSLMLERDPNAVATTTTTTDATPPAVTHDNIIVRRNYWPALIAFGVGGASAIFGSAMGGVAIGKKNDLLASCGGTTSCSGAQRGAFDDVSTFATVSTISFVIAGVAAAAGVVLVVLAPKRTIVEHVAFSVTPMGASIAGTF